MSDQQRLASHASHVQAARINTSLAACARESISHVSLMKRALSSGARAAEAFPFFSEAAARCLENGHVVCSRLRW
jgi:hypothetical protein